MKIYFKDELFDAQFLRALSAIYYGGADIGECFATAQRIKETNLESWYQEWISTAAKVEAQAEASLAAGHPVSAREAFLRAATYYRTAYIFMFKTPVDPRLVDAFDKQTACFQKAAPLFTPAFESISIPYENTTLPGYFYRADNSGMPRPTLVVNGGYDGTNEENYFFCAAAALRRGYHCLCFDGPGQGAVLIKQGITFRPDWEKVLTPVREYVATLPEVDQDKVALTGVSFGGFLAARALCFEHRFAAFIADPADTDLYAIVTARIPPILAHQLPDGNPIAIEVLKGILHHIEQQPTEGWGIRRGMWTHGAPSPIDYIRMTHDYTVREIAGQIQCPTLVCAADNDPISASAQEFYDALACPKAFMTFTDAEGAGEHCEIGGRSLFHQRTFDWLDATLGVD